MADNIVTKSVVSAASHTASEFELYVGDDGLLHG